MTTSAWKGTDVSENATVTMQPDSDTGGVLLDLVAATDYLSTTHRLGLTTWEAVEEMLSHLEDAEAVAFPSGMAAISAVLFGLLRAGDRILLPSDAYYTPRVLAERFFAHGDVRSWLLPFAAGLLLGEALCAFGAAAWLETRLLAG